MPDTWVLMVLLMVVCLVLWLRQLVKLMGMSDAQFPGRYDKILWVVILLVTAVVGAVAFWIWRTWRETNERVQAETTAAVKKAVAMNRKGSATEGDTSDST